MSARLHSLSYICVAVLLLVLNLMELMSVSRSHHDTPPDPYSYVKVMPAKCVHVTGIPFSSVRQLVMLLAPYPFYEDFSVRRAYLSGPPFGDFAKARYRCRISCASNKKAG